MYARERRNIYTLRILPYISRKIASVEWMERKPSSQYQNTVPSYTFPHDATSLLIRDLSSNSFSLFLFFVLSLSRYKEDKVYKSPMTNERLVKKRNASEDKEAAISGAVMRCSLFLFVPKYMEYLRIGRFREECSFIVHLFTSIIILRLYQDLFWSYLHIPR